MKILSIKKSAEFQKIGKKGQKFYAKTLLLLSLPSPQIYFQNLEKGQLAKDFCRVGYTVAKTVSKSAVVRNTAKRRLREASRVLFIEHAKKNHDYVVIARKEISDADFDKIFADLKFCLKRIHQLPKPQVNTDRKSQ